ncbi:MAG TPA: UDP-N-acetylmuramate dehydrogenase [Thermoanaerobaculia bacterium]|nr:UDP-N-acetylmuramate dehydrogenase [Thermoanaerobaculia bacterium]
MPERGYEALRRELGSGRVRLGEILAPYTSFRIGGPADLFYEAESGEELAGAVLAARASGVPWFLLGLGANILVGDRGFRGLVIRNRARRVDFLPGGQVRAESGVVVFPDLIDRTIENGLSGLEHFVGIPSTVGGALWQNLHFLSPAPARERTVFIAEVTQEAEVLTEEGERRVVDAAWFEFAYDRSILHHHRHVALAATFALTPGDPARMREVVRENLEWRALRHPPLATEPSAGSIFKKIEGVGAGRLIEECGLKGATRGGAMVTHRHANIMINRGGATAADVRALIDHVQAVVLERTGQRLEPEISFVGEF